jgi:aryl-alcohol dehydrogenase-like predicted oxidoreductase
MEYAHLGRTGLKVSRLCLGTMNFGPFTSEADSFVLMDKALEVGINFFDTANVYGRVKGEGVTEQIIGRWLTQGRGRREKIVLATKVYGGMGDWPNESKLSAYHIRRACEESLRRLQTDHIDLYQMHHIDRETPWEEIWQALQVLVQQGKVIYVGSSNFPGWHIARAQAEAKARHFMGLVSEQSLYNLTARMIELEVIPACRAHGLGLIPWSPLAGGLLGGALTKGNTASTPKDHPEPAYPDRITSQTSRDTYLDLKTRIQAKLIARLDPKLDIARTGEGRKRVEDLFKIALAEENILLSRVEYERLLDLILDNILADKGRRASGQAQARLEKLRPQLEAYEGLCQEIGEKPADVALAWLLHNPVVTAPIIGPRTIEQLEGSLRAVELKLTDDVLKKLDEIFPGPGGEAPEAYAW